VVLPFALALPARHPQHAAQELADEVAKGDRTAAGHWPLAIPETRWGHTKVAPATGQLALRGIRSWPDPKGRQGVPIRPLRANVKLFGSGIHSPHFDNAVHNGHHNRLSPSLLCQSERIPAPDPRMLCLRRRPHSHAKFAVNLNLDATLCFPLLR